ncbi:sensor histidine kinase [Aliikangiella coralliicola]|uniref:Signal transduction histidine kinase internal region domain-containing protein n=1 Tax=Aliikangiella coralliicola TaxID=2592383 RepID=A0A545UGM2_9GAMM|nr:histidine kinase [Aliikangiella coralliicola]TQV88618.1 hypothetical protein FLL46_08875 [Aliikangiella coralliicola]
MLRNMKLSSFNSKALIANFIIWAAFITISLSASIIDSERAGHEFNYSLRTTGYLISFIPWMFVTPFFYWVLQKQQKLKRLSILKTSLFLLIAWAPLVAFFETKSFMVIRDISDRSMLDIVVHLPIFYWVYCLMLFCAVMGACLSLIYYQRYDANKLEALKIKQANVELELQLSELRMKSLQTQLEPHFLFNSLNSIASLVRITEKKQALTAIKQLSDLLRYAVEASSHKFVPIDNEIDFVQDYLSLQSLRFDDKLSVEFIDKRTSHNQECPPFLLQIFVENAIKHGLERCGDSMDLIIKISDLNNSLTLFIQNTHQRTQTKTRGLGIGLSNLKSRLEILYRDTIEFNTFETSQHYTVEIVVPAFAKDD